MVQGTDKTASEPDDPSSTEQRWRVLKFGGTSVSSLARWESIESILRRRIDAGTSVVLVCSAVAGVTDLLTELVATARGGKPIDELLTRLRERHAELGQELGIPALDIISGELAQLERLLSADDIGADVEARIMGHGELMSTRLGAAWLTRRGIATSWIDARDLLTSDCIPEQRDEDYLSASCSPAPSRDAQSLVASENASVVITQGFIARSPDGQTVLLGRGGSDTSAAYLACLLAAERLEIWTDVPGLFTANPREVPDARMLIRVGYREAQALGALGAKALHPRAIEAVWEHGIPVEIGWTSRPDVEGTCINAARAASGIKAITSRKRLAMFSFRRPPSWQPVGFLADVAEQFAKRGLSMDLVSSSCSEIRITIDLDAFPSAEDEIPAILSELEKSCQVRVVSPVASVSIVGEGVGQTLLGNESVFDVFAAEALFMVVHAANEHHVSFVLDGHAAEHLVRTAHERLIGTDPELHELGPTWEELTSRPPDEPKPETTGEETAPRPPAQ